PFVVLTVLGNEAEEGEDLRMDDLEVTVVVRHLRPEENVEQPLHGRDLLLRLRPDDSLASLQHEQAAARHRIHRLDAPIGEHGQPAPPGQVALRLPRPRPTTRNKKQHRKGEDNPGDETLHGLMQGNENVYTKSAKIAKRSGLIRSRENQSLYAVLQDGFVPIDKKANRRVEQFHVADELRLVD